MSIFGGFTPDGTITWKSQLARATAATFIAGSVFAMLRLGGELKKVAPDAFNEVVSNTLFYTGFMGVCCLAQFVIWPRIRRRSKCESKRTAGL